MNARDKAKEIVKRKINYPKTRKPPKTPRTGRPPTVGGKRTSIFLTEEQSQWCKSHNVSLAEYIRRLIVQDIEINEI